MKTLLQLALLLCSQYTILAQYLPAKQENKAFKRGEKLTYRIHYGLVDAVTASLEVTQDNKKFGGRNTLHVVGIGRSRGTFDFFFKVRDRYESYIDEEALVPWFFGRRVDEGGYKISQNYTFNHAKGTVHCEDRTTTTVKMVKNTQDMISGFYYARTLDLGNLKMNQIVSVPTIVDGEMFTQQIKFKGKEMVKTNWGLIRCLKFVPIVQRGRIFKKEEDLLVWISDDVNHVPIKAKAEILFGSIKLELTGYSGIMQPFSFSK